MSNNLQNAAKHVSHLIENAPESLKTAVEDTSDAMQTKLVTARRSMSRMASKVEKAAKANPLATAGVLVGAGALLGALLHSALRPAPTAGELILRELKRNAELTGDTFKSGMKSARRAMR